MILQGDESLILTEINEISRSQQVSSYSPKLRTKHFGEMFSVNIHCAEQP